MIFLCYSFDCFEPFLQNLYEKVHNIMSQRLKYADAVIFQFCLFLWFCKYQPQSVYFYFLRVWSCIHIFGKECYFIILYFSAYKGLGQSQTLISRFGLFILFIYVPYSNDYVVIFRLF